MPGTAYVTRENLNERARAWERAVEGIRRNELTALPNPALLVIDMQRYFFSPEGRAHLPAAQVIMPNITNLIAAFRVANRPIIFTRHGHRRNGDAGLMAKWWKERLLIEDDPDAELAPELEIAATDMIIRKETYDAFRNTALEAALKDNDIASTVICGVMTDLCVETTARQAFLNGFQPTIALDGTATKTETLHLAALQTLAHGFAFVADTKDMCATMTS